MFSRTGLTKGEFTALFFRSEDRERQWRKLNRKKECVKIRRMRNLYMKLKEGREKLAADKQKGNTYGSGMMMGTELLTGQPTKKAKKNNVGRCRHCNLDSHMRVSSGLCPKNPKNITKEKGELHKKHRCKYLTIMCNEQGIPVLTLP